MKLLICMLALCGIMGSGVPAMCAETEQENDNVQDVGDVPVYIGTSGGILGIDDGIYPINDQCTVIVMGRDDTGYSILHIDQVDRGSVLEIDDYDPGEGKVFNGWYTEPDGKGERWYSGSTVTENLKLFPYVTDAEEETETPVQSEEIYTIVFISEDKEYSSYSTAENDSTLKFPDDPSKAGYRFDGWYTEPDGKGIKAESGGDVTNDIKLYAYYTPKSSGGVSTGVISTPASQPEPTQVPETKPETGHEAYVAPRPTEAATAGPVNTAVQPDTVLWWQNPVDIDIVIVTDGMKIYVNGQEVYFDDTVPFVDKHGNTYAPVRPFAQMLGFEVEWDEYNMVALLKKGNSVISLDTVSGMLHRNGVLMKRYVGARRIDGTTYVFVRALAEAEGYKVEYVTENEYSQEQ